MCKFNSWCKSEIGVKKGKIGEGGREGNFLEGGGYDKPGDKQVLVPERNCNSLNNPQGAFTCKGKKGKRAISERVFGRGWGRKKDGPC